MIRVWMIRHGESESNAGLSSKDPESSLLTAVGRAQADQVALAFAEAPALVVTSPYVRARQTAEPTISRFPGAGLQEWPVQEFTYLGELRGQMMTASERDPYARAFWEKADPHYVSGGAESFAGLISRASEFLGRLSTQSSGPVAVFTHGNFMRAVAWSLLTGITSPDSSDMRSFRRFANRYPIPNGAITELRCIDDMHRLLSGSTAHLPAALAQGEG